MLSHVPACAATFTHGREEGSRTHATHMRMHAGVGMGGMGVGTDAHVHRSMYRTLPMHASRCCVARRPARSIYIHIYIYIHACTQVLRGEATSSLRLDHPDAVMMRSSAYVTVAKLCQRVPEIVQADLNLPSQLFAWLETEPLAARTSLQEALAALAEVHARKPGAPPPPPSMTSALRVLLLKVSSSLTFPSLACPSPSHAPLSRCPSLSPVCECHVPVRVVASSVPSACECACIAHGRVLAA